MTWIKFAFWLCGSYTGYYTLMILWDTLRGRGGAAVSASHELTFVEDIEPIRSEPDAVAEDQGSPIISSGGVSLKTLFNLAREEAIEFTRPVSF